jgi:RNA polymerase sigma factor (sigma-70 family)
VSDSIQATRFQQVALPHLKAAFNLARWLTCDDHRAEDVVQEAYLRAFKFFGSFRGGDARPWLLAIVRNTFYTMQRQHAGEQYSTPFDEECHSQEDNDTGFVSPVTNEPESNLVHEDARRLITQALESLPLEFREVLVMRELEDLAYEQIADIAGIPIGTVMSRLARGRKLLARRLARTT